MDGSYSGAFRAELADLMRWRRDVRRFRSDLVAADVLARCLAAFGLAPSVGLSEPWRVIAVESPAARAAALANFETANAQALAGYAGEKARLYSQLKLSGMREAPLQLAVFCDDGTAKGAGLGAATMPETRAYSVVGAITLFWLAARAEGLGVGWVSILDAPRLARDLDVPADWRLIGYLCVGWPETLADTPELEQIGWERRGPVLMMEAR
ncbi:MAG: 5,6-dimethylbenzimidazole synthase [Pseudorhodobacter sp.]|nr:5,6-dimethylbenzimidazole synthase [Pseudorhodobacter sp.]